MRHDVFEPNTPEREIVKGSIPQAKKVSQYRKWELETGSEGGPVKY